MKKNRSQPKPKVDTADPEMERAVFRGLLAEGYIVPETPEELRTVEPEPDNLEVPLPASLNDPDAVLRRIQERIASRDTKTVPFPLPQEADVDEELSRAARHGRKLSPQIKTKMAKNRREEDRKREVDGTPQ